ncbi:immunoglobulin superfamily member 10-like isoform X2 [Pecten maximus]|uniref:immunoglobulin superfamily member 10-like isoform X2 n=1 Tax=Pecten maximus TaxID=6579 RepID=UPI001458718F|nr:immunoglobulin superfamily member 10-like isoform X2 [Pecten maximus]
MNRWRAFASLLTAMITCIETSIPTNNRNPDNAAFDCEGEVGKGTLAHQVRFPNGIDVLLCCYPVNCTGGKIEFCKKDMENDTCVPCQDGCNYHSISSGNSFHLDQFCNHPCIYAVPVVEFISTQYIKHRGDTVTLQPKIYSDYPLQGSCWELKNSSGSYDLAGCNSTDFNSRKYKVGDFQDPFLIINNLKLSDQGIYQLSVWNENGVSISSNVTLNVTARPLVIMKESDTVDEGSVYDIRCHVKGNPEPNIVKMTFTGNDRQESKQLDISTQRDGYVTHRLQNVSAKDSGNYTCIAENTEGHGEKTQQLIVFTRPQISSPEEGKNLTCDVGEYISIPVSVTSNPKLTNFSCHQLSDNSKTMSTFIYHSKDNTVTYNVSIQNTQLSHTGKYICMASNRLGTNNISVSIVVKSGETTEPRVPVTNDIVHYVPLALTLSIAVVAVVILVLYLCRTRDAKRQREGGSAVEMEHLQSNSEQQ